VETYEEVAPYARAIWLATAERFMPPWKPEPGFGGPFVGERHLSDAEVELLRRWAFAGAPRGEAAPEGAMAHMDHDMGADGGWQLGTPTTPDIRHARLAVDRERDSHVRRHLSSARRARMRRACRR
jgi:hypothetical protein